MPVAGWGQDVYWNKTYNVYRRDAATILNYVKEYIQQSKLIEDKELKCSNGEIVISTIQTIKQGPLFCFGTITFTGDIAFMAHVIKSSIFLMDMGKFAEVNEVYGRYFDEQSAPARETVGVWITKRCAGGDKYDSRDAVDRSPRSLIKTMI